jgi:hypothetical protein
MNTDRICTIAFRTLATGMILLLLLCALASLTGCESRNFSATRTDGTVITYHRVSIFGDSSSEGVSIAKDGGDLSVEVGATGSQANISQVIELLQAIPTP